MKKAVFFLLSAALLAGACQKYDDTALQNRIGNLENRVTTLEATVNTLNGNVSSLQTLVQALQDEITISVISKNKDGFTITFSDGQTVEIRNGEGGAQGEKGDAPVIGVKADNGIFYWTVDGEWLLDAAGQKVAVSGGVPTLKIEGDHWFVSYDGTNWQDLGKVEVTGGSSDLTITEDDNYVYFTFQSTGETIKISKTSRFTIDIEGTDYFFVDGKGVEIPYSIYGADGTEHLFIQSNGFTTSFDAEKIYVTPNEGVAAGDVLVYAVRNSDQRMCGVVLSFDEGVFQVTEAAKVPAAGGEVSVTVKTNLTYEVVIPEEAQSWLSAAVSTKATVREDAVTFTVQPNEGAARSATVTLRAQGAATLTVTIYQEAKGGSAGGDISATTVSDFISKADADTYYRLTGTVSAFKTGTTSAGKNWMQFNLTDNSGTILVYGFKDGEYDKWATTIKNGGTVTLNGTYQYYEKNSQHEVVNATIESFTAGEDPGTGGETSEIKTVTVAEFLAAAESDTQKYQLTGTIGGTINTTYGNFDLTDETGTVYVYGLTATELGYGEKNDRSYASLNLKAGDVITIIGYRGVYTNANTGDKKDEVMYAYFVEKVSSGSEPETPDTPVEGAITIDFTAQGYENAADFTELTVSGVNVTGDKGDNRNGPKYYTTGDAVRFYGGNSLTVSASKKIESITFTFASGEGTNEITASAGTWTSPTWTGSASSVTFTVGGTSGHRRIQKLVVKLAE